MTVKELREICHKWGVRSGGNKQNLVHHLLDRVFVVHKKFSRSSGGWSHSSGISFHRSSTNPWFLPPTLQLGWYGRQRVANYWRESPSSTQGIRALGDCSALCNTQLFFSGQKKKQMVDVVSPSAEHLLPNWKTTDQFSSSLLIQTINQKISGLSQFATEKSRF